MTTPMAGRTTIVDSSCHPSIYQHPLAYLIGLEGVALLKAFAGEDDREFTDARLAEVRALLDTGDVLGRGVEGAGRRPGSPRTCGALHAPAAEAANAAERDEPVLIVWDLEVPRSRTPL